MRDAAVRGRLGTVAAVGFLVLDGVLLLVASAWGGSVGPAIGGVVCLVLAGLVVLYWRRHRRLLGQLAAAREAVRREAEELRDLLRR